MKLYTALRRCHCGASGWSEGMPTCPVCFRGLYVPVTPELCASDPEVRRVVLEAADLIDKLDAPHSCLHCERRHVELPAICDCGMPLPKDPT